MLNKSIILLLLGLLITNNGLAQCYKAVEYTGEYVYLITHELNEKSYIVENQRNTPYKDRIKNYHPHQDHVIVTPLKNHIQLAKKAFANEKLQHLKKDKEVIYIMFGISPNGVVLEIIFIISNVSEQCLITIKEIEKMEKILKNELKFTFDEQLKGVKFYQRTFPIYFEKH